jgi:hypothetical protein
LIEAVNVVLAFGSAGEKSIILYNGVGTEIMKFFARNLFPFVSRDYAGRGLLVDVRDCGIEEE